ncbi:MAG: hypothetical protein ACKO45_14195 [Cyanobium sp.]
MGRSMACPSCGSWAVKADRGLAGRMVCARCGQPLGLGASAGSARRVGSQRGLSLPKRWRLWLALASLVGLSAALAAQAPSPSPRRAPPLAPAPAPLGSPGQPGGLGM